LQHFFAADTNIVFLNICIENRERIDAWRQLIQNKNIGGINVFYARNQPQRVTLLRRLGVNDYPTYVLVNNLIIIGANAPRPSNKGFVHWAIYAAGKNRSLANAYQSIATKCTESQGWLLNNWAAIEALKPKE